MIKKPRLFPNSGFSMIEIMIAVMVIGVGVIPVFYMLSSGTRGIQFGIREVKAVNHVANVIELFRGISYDELREFCEDGALEARQQGWLIYKRGEGRWVTSAEAEGKGVWDISQGSGVGRDFFAEFLNPVEGDAREGVLSPMEVFYKARKVMLTCNQLACSVEVEVEWEREFGEDSGGTPELKSFKLRAVVVNPGRAG